jgi:hypothetical protein
VFTELLPGNALIKSVTISIARQRRGKQALATIQAVFSVGSTQSGYKRSELRSWELLRVQGEKSTEEYKDDSGACPSDL